MATVTLKGNPIHLCGELPKTGSAVPDFHLVDSNLNDQRLKDFAGKKKLFNIVPSLDTPVCQLSTRKLNEYAKTHADVAVLIVSADLPFAQKRFTEGEQLGAVVPLSLMRTRSFAKDYGVLIEDGPLAGITARAIVVTDAQDRVVYTELVPEIAQEPNYDAALAALAK